MKGRRLSKDSGWMRVRRMDWSGWEERVEERRVREKTTIGR